MWVESVKVNGFRNLTGPDGELELEFCGGVNVLRGLNAQGKTNMIEAIYFCATAHSHRTNVTKEMIRFGEDLARVQVFVAKGSGKNIYQNRINVLLKNAGRNRAGKSAAVNGVAIDKLGDLLGVLYCVIFSPEDLGLIKAGPSERRRFMDMELCQVNRVYYYELKQYYRILKQRNSLLKSLQKSGTSGQLMETLELWDAQLTGSGSRISVIRRAYVDEISVLAAKIHMGLCGEELQALYKPSALPDELPERFKKNRNKDIINGTTTCGIHKDDIIFLLDGLDSRIYGSQGQQRTAALSLKLAEVELIRREKGENPVLLLDDVMSELDRKRQEQLLESIGGIQTFIACTTAEDSLNINGAAEYVVQGGKIFIQQ
ncbi:MAG: DNA replication/repair protein RecF [Defluviitaleaceae bacterium]|nr:DNA replication/repair protein RecF [Defluviitaleaceae bacterium]MCL2835932.1 DNA replication/repair protein RecF [Defluviitaleaceae bacterium]